MGKALLVSGIPTKRNSLVQSLAHDPRGEQQSMGNVSDQLLLKLGWDELGRQKAHSHCCYAREPLCSIFLLTSVFTLKPRYWSSAQRLWTPEAIDTDAPWDGGHG